jgi:hypothetical protein
MGSLLLVQYGYIYLFRPTSNVLLYKISILFIKYEYFCRFEMNEPPTGVFIGLGLVILVIFMICFCIKASLSKEGFPDRRHRNSYGFVWAHTSHHHDTSTHHHHHDHGLHHDHHSSTHHHDSSNVGDSSYI